MNSKKTNFLGNEETQGFKARKVGLGVRESSRVVITNEANMALEQVVKKVGEGFYSAITKSDVANFVFLNLDRLISDADIKAIRGLHFDDKKVLGSLLKNDDDLPEDLKKAIRSYYGISEKEKKKTTRALSDLSTDAPVDKSPPGE